MRGGQSTDAEHRGYLEAQFASNAEFWARFGRRPEFAGRRLLDLGCGHGAMSVDAARSGADVLGIDLDADRVAFAARHHASLGDAAGRLDFRVVDLDDLGAVGEFDLVVSKDTFEHVADMGRMVRSIERALKPGGELWAGFSPLYFSPFGGHSRTGLRRIPWAHAVLPRRLVLRAASRYQGASVRSLQDIGLNGMTPAEFRAHVAAADLEVVSFAYNRGDKPLLRVLDRLRRVPRLEPFATVSIYAVLRKR